ncbi:MAG: hypothetical protein KDC46_15565 [Thermoleophilia bacterium]|nr:hypothetical protein [Thermoleophilia bacterium]
MRSIELSLLDDQVKRQTFAPVAVVVALPGRIAPNDHAARSWHELVSEIALGTVAVTTVDDDAAPARAGPATTHAARQQADELRRCEQD